MLVTECHYLELFQSLKLPACTDVCFHLHPQSYKALPIKAILGQPLEVKIGLSSKSN